MVYPFRKIDSQNHGETFLDRLVQPAVTPTQLFKPFVLKCPICMAPTEMGETKCQYCNTPMVWEPVHSLSRDDQYYRYADPSPEASWKDGSFPMGLGPVVVASNAGQHVQCIPQRSVKLVRLLITDMCADHFWINRVQVGVSIEMDATGSGFPASVAKITAGGLDASTCREVMVGMHVTIEVTNITSSPQVFQGLFQVRSTDPLPWPGSKR
jgi:hypothetical protein